MRWNRSSEQRRLSLRPAVLLLALAALLALLLPGGGDVARAQTPAALVSNIEQTPAAGVFFTFDLAQEFTTGSGTGFTLSSLEIRLRTSSLPSPPPTVTLHIGSATGLKVADFTGPSEITHMPADYTFTPTTTVTLNPYTKYWVVAEGTGGSWRATSRDAEDSGAPFGWSITDVKHYRIYTAKNSRRGLRSRTACRSTCAATPTRTCARKKITFMTEDRARWSSERASNRKVYLRPYYEKTCGFYHLTSQRPREYA